jgi:hypothetical protein
MCILRRVLLRRKRSYFEYQWKPSQCSCQRVPHIRRTGVAFPNSISHFQRFANDTQLWREKVLLVAGMDCARDVKTNLRSCTKQRVKEFPTIRLYFGSEKILNELSEVARSEDLMRAVVDLVEKQQDKKPDAWPNLSPYM